MHKCYFCQSIMELGTCYECPNPVQHFYRLKDNSLHLVMFPVLIKNVSYTVFLDLSQQTCEIMDPIEKILQFSCITNINPTNAADKIKTLLVFS